MILVISDEYLYVECRYCSTQADSNYSLFQLKMPGKLPLVLVASLALVSVAAAHSVEKRQTTVSKSAACPAQL